MKTQKDDDISTYNEVLDKLLKLNSNKAPKIIYKIIACITVCIIAIVFAVLLCFIICKNNFTLESILSVLLAFFSIFISVLFYFKADEANSKFYDSSYNFMKDVSVTLGKIEERFGEKLNSMNEKLSHMENEKTETQQEIATAESEKDQIINDLLKKSKMSETEQQQYKAKLARKEEETELLKRRLYKMENNQICLYDNRMKDSSKTESAAIFINSLSSDNINRLLQGEALKDISNKMLQMGLRSEVINSQGFVTEIGKELIQAIYMKNYDF